MESSSKVGSLATVLCFAFGMAMPVHTVADPLSTMSIEQCARINGIWQAAYRTMYQCEAPITKAECEASPASHWDYRRTPVCIFNASEAANATLCKQDGGQWGLNDASVAHCYFDKDKENCLKVGGEWVRTGFEQIAYCIWPTPDANRPCTSSRECKNRCVASLPEEMERRSNLEKLTHDYGNDNIGKCNPFDTYFCGPTVERGRIVFPEGCRIVD